MSDLKPANENPWYVLMTLYGEQEGEEIDWELHEKNRRAWNAWAGQALSDKQKKHCAESSGIDVAELSAWRDLQDEIKRRHKEAWESKNAEGIYPGLPEAKDVVDLTQTAFSNTVVLKKTVFASLVSFYSASFTAAAFFSSAIFQAAAVLSCATFQAAAVFRSATFQAAAVFSSASFEGFCYFVETNFGLSTGTKTCPPVFRDCQFAKPTSFRAARFATHTPDFEGAVLHDKTTFTAEEEDKDGPFWPVIRSGPPHQPQFWTPFSDQPAKDARDSYAAIRHAVAKQGLPDDEHFFFRREMHYAGR